MKIRYMIFGALILSSCASLKETSTLKENVNGINPEYSESCNAIPGERYAGAEEVSTLAKKSNFPLLESGTHFVMGFATSKVLVKKVAADDLCVTFNNEGKVQVGSTTTDYRSEWIVVPDKHRP